MRTRAILVFALSTMVVLVACSSGSSGGLTGKVWHLTAITEKVPAFQGVVPDAQQANYTIEFKSSGTFDAKADCNNLSGSYTTTSSGGLTIVPGPMTLAICPPGSMSDQYVTSLGKAASYAIANDQLTITLTDGGTLAYK